MYIRCGTRKAPLSAFVAREMGGVSTKRTEQHPAVTSSGSIYAVGTHSSPRLLLLSSWLSSPFFGKKIIHPHLIQIINPFISSTAMYPYNILFSRPTSQPATGSASRTFRHDFSSFSASFLWYPVSHNFFPTTQFSLYCCCCVVRLLYIRLLKAKEYVVSAASFLPWVIPIWYLQAAKWHVLFGVCFLGCHLFFSFSVFICASFLLCFLLLFRSSYCFSLPCFLFRHCSCGSCVFCLPDFLSFPSFFPCFLCSHYSSVSFFFCFLPGAYRSYLALSIGIYRPVSAWNTRNNIITSTASRRFYSIIR